MSPGKRRARGDGGLFQRADGEGFCLCGRPVAADNTDYCHECLEASEHEDDELI